MVTLLSIKIIQEVDLKERGREKRGQMKVLAIEKAVGDSAASSSPNFVFENVTLKGTSTRK